MVRILGADGGAGTGAFFKLDDSGAPTRSVGWHTLEADISDNGVKYYVDSILSKTVNISSLTDRSLDTVKLGSNLSSTCGRLLRRRLRWRVPEPACFDVDGIGLHRAAGRRRRVA